MNKKLKFAIPFAVLAISCGAAMGMTGCKNGKDEHTHNYSEWHYEGDKHWKECPDDGAVDENTRGGHVFVAGECECGAKEPVVEVKYGTVTGKVKLVKNGAAVTDQKTLESIEVDMGDGVEFTDSVEEGVYTFTVTKVKVGTEYNLTITCDGYKSYTALIELEEEGEEVKIGGENGITLNYELFGLLAGYDAEYHDFSQANDTDKIIKFLKSDGNKTLNAITKESYGDVAASLKIKYYNSSNNMHTQGIVLKFSDGKHVIVRYHNGDQKNGNIQYVDNAWDPCKKEDTLFGAEAGLNQWGEAPIHTLLDAETAAIKEEGLDLQLILKDGTLYTFFAGNYVAKYALPEGYADKQVQVGYFAWNVAAEGATFNYDITSTVPENMTGKLDIKVTQPEGVTGCTVTATNQKETYELGEQVELAITVAEGYQLGSLTVGGVEMRKAIVNGKLNINVNQFDLKVVASFVEAQPIALNLTVRGNKLGKTANLAEGTAVTFKGTDYTFTVGADGKITKDSVAQDTYTVAVEGYVEKEIKFDENLTEIVLDYDLMENLTLKWGWGDYANLDEQNDGKLTQANAATQWVSSKDSYDSVAITASIVKGGNRQGVFIRFKGNTYGEDKYAMIQKEGNAKISWNGENNLWGNGSNMLGDVWTDYVNPLTDEDLAAIEKGEYELTLVRVQNKIHVFINGNYYDTKILDAAYADAKCYVGVYCTDTPANAARTFKIEDASGYVVKANVTDETATGAHGSLGGIPEEVKLGDDITLTITPDEGYKLAKLFVGGKDVTANVTGTTYTFTVTGDTTVKAEFEEIKYGSINAQISGNKFGVAGNSVTASDSVTLSASGFEDITATITDGETLTLSVAKIPAGKWTVNVAGYKPAEITVAENAAYDTAIVLKPVEEFTLIKNWGNVSSVIAADGSAALTITNEMETAVSNTTYDDISVTVNLSGTNMTKNDGSTGTQGIVFRFSDDKLAILRMQGRSKIQFACSTDWYQGGTADGCSWQDLIFFTDKTDTTEKDKYLTAFDAGTLKMTAVRKGATIYAILTIGENSEIIGYRTIDEKYKTDKAKVGMFCEGTENGAAKTWNFAVGDATAALATVATELDTGLTAYGGTWTKEGTTLKVSGKGYAEFKAEANTVKESATIKIKDDVGGDQGFIYSFADGKYIAIRYQKNNGNYKIQYTCDTVFFYQTDYYLKGWTDFMMTDAEKAAFDASGLDLTFIRDGAKFYIVLGDRVLDLTKLDDKYATMAGVMAIQIWDGKNAAFAYDHKTGDSVAVPQNYYVINASFDGDACGYEITLDKTFVEKDGKVTVTVRSDPDRLGWNSWSKFPAKIVVNGQETALTVADFVSDGANKLHCTKEFTVTADTEIKVTIAAGTVISKGVVVTVKDNVGGTATSDSGEDGYYWNDACTLYITPAEGYEIASITVDGGTPITSGWTFNAGKNRYEYNIADPIHQAIAVVVEFKATTPAGGEEGGTTPAAPETPEANA